MQFIVIDDEETYFVDTDNELAEARQALTDAGLSEADVWSGNPEDGDAVKTGLKVFATRSPSYYTIFRYVDAETRTEKTGSWTGQMDDAVAAAVAYLNATPTDDAMHVYTADETQSEVLVTQAELAELGAALLTVGESADAYSLWASTTGRPVEEDRAWCLGQARAAVAALRKEWSGAEKAKARVDASDPSDLRATALDLHIVQTMVDNVALSIDGQRAGSDLLSDLVHDALVAVGRAKRVFHDALPGLS